MATYTVLGIENHYQKFDNYASALDCAKRAEVSGRKVQIVETRKGNDWTVYETLSLTDARVSHKPSDDDFASYRNRRNPQR